MADSDVFNEDKLFKTFVQRGRAFGLQEKDLMECVDKQITQAQERQERQEARQLELAAIKQREETARQTAKEETARKVEKKQARGRDKKTSSGS